MDGIFGIDWNQDGKVDIVFYILEMRLQKR